MRALGVRRVSGASVALVLLGTSLGCGAARTREANARAIAAADARVLEGCYDCLLAARTAYARLADAKTLENSKRVKTRDSVIIRLFETDVLLALREKELALDWRRTIQRARSLVPRLPASVDSRRLLGIVDAVLPDANGVPPKSLAAMRRERAAFVGKIADELAWLAKSPLRSPVRDYVALALDCSYFDRIRTPGRIGSARKRPELPPGAPPLIAYRTGICAGSDTAMLARVRGAVPAFAEAAYYEGQAAAFAAEETGGDDARALLERAYTRFPRAPGVTFTSGWLGTVVGDCASAVRYYGETIAIDPTHEYALLQRTICLTNMRQDTGAIATATQLILLETQNTGQAYYWRALNRLRRKELDQARSDIEAAKALERAPNVLTLAGIIEHDQDDLAIAEQDLRAARALYGGEENCTAAWYLGLVLTKRKQWPQSADVFESAMACYVVKVSDLGTKIARLRTRTTANPAFVAKRIAALEADSTEQRVRYHASAFNAAGNHAAAGNVPRANELLEIASVDPKLADPIAKLRESLAGTRPSHRLR